MFNNQLYISDAKTDNNGELQPSFPYARAGWQTHGPRTTSTFQARPPDRAFLSSCGVWTWRLMQPSPWSFLAGKYTLQIFSLRPADLTNISYLCFISQECFGCANFMILSKTDCTGYPFSEYAYLGHLSKYEIKVHCFVPHFIVFNINRYLQRSCWCESNIQNFANCHPGKVHSMYVK